MTQAAMPGTPFAGRTGGYPFSPAHLPEHTVHSGGELGYAAVTGTWDSRPRGR